MTIIPAYLPGGIIGPELAKISGLPYQTVHYYTVHGILVPEQAARGRGSRRLYGFNDAVAATVLEGLRRYGASLAQLKSVAREIHGFTETEMLAAAHDAKDPQVGLLIGSDGSVRRVGDLPLLSTLDVFDFTDALIVNISKLASSIRDRLTELRLRGPRRVPKIAARAKRKRPRS